MDTPLFPIYLVFAGIGVFANLWVAFLIYRQSRLIRHQVRTSHIATRATIRSARAAQNSADTSKLALELAERADVLMDGIGFADAQGRIFPNSRPIFHFKNTGRTRAVNVTFGFYLTVPDADRTRMSETPPITIGPQCKQELPFKALRECFTEQTFNDILGGKIPLSFDGKVSYNDVFGHTHWARYSGTYDHNSRTFLVGKHETD